MAKPPSFIQRLQSPGLLQYRRCLVYGPSRAGKTTFLGSAAFDDRTAPMLVLDFGGGSSSLSGIDPDLLSVFPVQTWDDFSEAYEYLANEDHSYRSVAIDSLTDTHLYALLNVVDLAVANLEKRKDLTEIQQGDYGKAMIQLRRFLIAIRTLPMHCFFTALAKTENEPREGWIRKPALFGQMSEEVVGMFDTTGFLSFAQEPKGEPYRVLALQNYPSVRVGVRTPFGTTIPNEIVLGPRDGVTKLFNILNVPLSS